MKIIDKLINKIGSDKIIHVLLAGWLTQIGGLFGLYGIIAFPIVVILLGFLKEKYLDDFVDKKDILANVIGCSVATIINILSLIL